MKSLSMLKTALASAALAFAMSATAATPNPCAPHNPCAMKHNPCAMKKMNPCAAKNPCAASGHVDSAQITRPADYKPYKGKQSDLVKEGKKLFSNTKLSTNGMSCNTCHANHGAFQESFAQPYPHSVQMAGDRFGLKTIQLDEMVQLCMVAPMEAKPLPWDSKKLAALTAYTAELQKSYKPGGATMNPCAAKNPCAMKHNPCAMKKMNPCAAKNPCAPKKH